MNDFSEWTGTCNVSYLATPRLEDPSRYPRSTTPVLFGFSTGWQGPAMSHSRLPVDQGPLLAHALAILLRDF